MSEWTQIEWLRAMSLRQEQSSSGLELPLHCTTVCLFAAAVSSRNTNNIEGHPSVHLFDIREKISGSIDNELVRKYLHSLDIIGKEI